MHPTVLFFVLLFIPNTSLTDWQQANAPVLHQLMDHGALGVMNARTAEIDAITPEGGERTIFAGSRMSANRQVDSTLYSINSDNLFTALNNANIEILGVPQWTPLESPIDVPYTKQFLVETLGGGDWLETDRDIAAAAELVQREHGQLMIVSPNPSIGEYADQDQLTPILLWGQGVPDDCYMQSATTRTTGLIANTDIAPTIAAAMGAALPSIPYGTAVTFGRSPDDKVQALLHRQKAWITQAKTLKFLPYVAAVLAILILAAILTKPQHTELSLGIAAVTSLIPFVLLASSSVPIFAAFLALAVIIAIKALMPDDAAPLSALVIIIMVTIDGFVFGGRLTGGTLLGYSPIEGARYYGIGNEVLGTYVGALAVITGLWDWKGEHRTPLILLWIAAALAVGMPTGGAKAGGLLVCGVILAAYVSLTAGRKLRDVKTIATIGFSLIVSVLLLIGMSRFGPRTHVNDTIDMASAGGFNTILQTIARKLDMNFHLIFHSVWIWVLVLSSYGRWKLAKTDMLASIGTVATLACLLLNDAGVVAAAICGLTVWAAEFNRTYTKKPRTVNLTLTTIRT